MKNMCKKVMLILFLVGFFGAFGVIPSKAQNDSMACKNRIVNDSEKRDYVGDSFSIDVDDDDKLDTITARTYKVKVIGNAKSKVKETHWISFDLKTSKSKTIKSFFKYKYGDNVADYWIYALVSCQVNKDGKTDLLFYAGDDTSDETIILQNTGNSFKVISRKTKKN